MLAWPIKLLAYAMPSVPVPPIMSPTDMVPPMQTTSCTWPCVVPVGEDPAAHGHWCTFTDLYHAMPCHAISKTQSACPWRVTCIVCFFWPCA